MSVKIVVSLILAFLITVALMPGFISRMRRRQYGQQIREDGPSGHAVKAGTPTMGGAVFIPVAALSGLLFAGLSPEFLIALVIMLGCGLLGFFDDYAKIAHGRSLGLKARTKLACLIALSLLFIIFARIFGFYSPEIVVPFFNLVFDLGFLYPLFVFFVVAGCSNSVNLSDGVDGLAAGVSVFGLLAYLLVSMRAGFPEIALLCAALIGACLGFLIFNRHPARLFMGDAGSLALGGAFAAVALITGTELFLVIIGAVFVVEAISVMAQVVSFQLTGRRIFLMSPLHHHFELKGWSEWRVVLVFWGLALGFAVIGTLEFYRLA